jgi:HAD superfamily hydrolase (TIGR01509 family)
MSRQGAAPIDAVLFDCDGVLADSELLVNGLVAEDLMARGWTIDAETCRDTFLGLSLPTMVPIIESRVGPLPQSWTSTLAARIAVAVRERLEPIPGAMGAVAAVRDAGLAIAVASNAGRAELDAKLERLGLAAMLASRSFSAHDVRRPKPAPDLYLLAAASCGAAPARCVVVEDSLIGARAGIAAGCRVLGLTRETDAAVFRALGAEPFAEMAGLPDLLGLTRAAA